VTRAIFHWPVLSLREGLHAGFTVRARDLAARAPNSETAEPPGAPRRRRRARPRGALIRVAGASDPAATRRERVLTSNRNQGYVQPRNEGACSARAAESKAFARTHTHSIDPRPR
jgi:hypothetical protein